MDGDSTYGWCVNNGAALRTEENHGTGATKISSTALVPSEDANGNSNPKSDKEGCLEWLYDNAVRIGTGVSGEEISIYKKSLENMLEISLDGYSDEKIFAYEQYVIWNYTVNEIEPSSLPDEEFYTKLKEEADKHTSYSHVTPNVTISYDGASVNDRSFGPITIAISGGTAVFESTLGELYSDSTLTEKFVSSSQSSQTIYVKLNENVDVSSISGSIKYYYTNEINRRITVTESETDTPSQDYIQVYRATGEQQINKEAEGSFSIKIKKLGVNGEYIPNAGFKVSVVDNNNTTILNSNEEKTNSEGEVTFSGLDITAENLTYTITVTEETPPNGYIGIGGPISFEATSMLDTTNDEFKLVSKEENFEIENAKKVKINPNQILVEVENRPTSIEIHKGVKTVENQDSGYYAMDNLEETVYKDEVTGNNYTEIELEQLYHDWVIESTIPEGVERYKEYAVTDCVDTTKLDFSGLERVKVELVSQSGSITKLVKDQDYKAEYDEESHTLKVTYITNKDGVAFRGAFLSNADKSDKVRVTFNTTFRVDQTTGKLAVLPSTNAQGGISAQHAENQAILHYDNGSGEETKESENPEVHTGAVSVFKYEDTNGNKKHDEGEKALVGAEFKIALTEEDAKAGKFIKINGKELTAISNEHGIATFVGLEFGGDAKDDAKNLNSGLYKYDWEKTSKDYYIVETKTPAGYEKIEDVIKVTVSKDSSEIVDLTDKINEMESVGNKPLEFDLALRKWVTTAYVTENGITNEYKTGHNAEDDPEGVVKVDLKKSKINDVTVKFKYSIRVTNEGKIAGEAREITDYIPQGLKFVQEDNPDWTITDNERIVKTRKLEGVTLNPDESAEVEIVLTWINGQSTMGLMTNTAEISEDYNEFNRHDKDSTPNNKAPKEDDIDIAEVMLTVTTGSELIAYLSIGVGFITIILLGVVLIRKRFLELE